MFSVWIIIPLVAIIGAFVIEYQKNKLKMTQKTQQNEAKFDDLKTTLHSLEKRIENLEAIAASEPEEFKSHTESADFNLDDDLEDFKTENRQKVAHLANKKRSR